MYAYVYACVFVHGHTCGSYRPKLGIFLNCSTLHLTQGFSLNPDLTKWLIYLARYYKYLPISASASPGLQKNTMPVIL